MLAIPGFSLPGFFLHPADCPSLRTGKGRKRGFDKRESLGRERGRLILTMLNMIVLSIAAMI